MLRLTRTGKIFVMVIVVMHFASITSQSGLLIWLVGLISASVVVNAFGAYRAVRNVRLRAPSRVFIEEGSAPREAWQLFNDGKRRARLITIESSDRVWLHAAQIPPHGSVAIAPREVFKTRGVYSLEEAWIVSLFPFGLVKAMRPANCASEILVYPKLHETPAPEVRGLDPMRGGRQRGSRRVAVGETFAGVRPLQEGDSFKQIHWKSSAKGGGLMVKTFEEELAGRAALLVFCRPHSRRNESCLREAGALAAAGMKAGHQVEFHNLNENRRIRLSPFGETTRLLEELARFDVGESVASPESTRAVIDSIRPRVALHFVLSELTPAFVKTVDEAIAGGRPVYVHLPAGESGRLGWELRHFKVE